MRFVSVVVPGLADRDDEGVGHVRPQPEAGELRGGERFDAQTPVGACGHEGGREALARHVGGALPDDLHATDPAVVEPGTDLGAEHVLAEDHLEAVAAVDELARATSCGSWWGPP